MKNLISINKFFLFLNIFLTPLIYFGGRIYPFVTSKTYFFQGLVLVNLFFWLVLVLKDASFRINKKDFLYFSPFILFIFWLTVSAIFSADPHTSFWGTFSRGDGLIMYYHLLVFSFIVFSFVKKESLNFVKQILNVSFISSIFLVFSVWFGTNDKIFAGGGLMGNTSFAGSYLLFNIFFSFVLFILNNKYKYKYLYLLGVLFIFISPIFLSLNGFFIQARGAFLGIFVGLFSSLIFYFILSDNKKIKILGFSFLGIALVSSILIWINFMNPNSYLHKKFVEAATGTRFIFWDISIEGIKERPILGYGKENFRILFQEKFNPSILLRENLVEGFTDRAHNIFFDIGVWGGVPALVIYITALIYLCFALYDISARSILSKKSAAVLFGLIVAYVFQNLFVFDTLNSLLMFWMTISLILGLFVHLKDNKKIDYVNSSYQPYLIFAIFSLVLTAWIFFVYLPVRKAKLIHEIYNTDLVKRPYRYNELLKKIRVGNMYDMADFSQKIYVVYTNHLSSLLEDESKRNLAIKDILKYLEYAEVLLKENPYNYQLVLNMSRLGNIVISLQQGSPDNIVLSEKVFTWANQARDLSPSDPQPYWVLGQNSIFNGKIKEAVEYLEKSIQLEPRLDWGHELLIKLAFYSNNKDLYEFSLNRAKLIFPDLKAEEILDYK